MLIRLISSSKVNGKEGRAKDKQWFKALSLHTKLIKSFRLRGSSARASQPGGLYSPDVPSDGLPHAL